jgi:hypothetical protein
MSRIAYPPFHLILVAGGATAQGAMQASFEVSQVAMPTAFFQDYVS